MKQPLTLGFNDGTWKFLYNFETRTLSYHRETVLGRRDLKPSLSYQKWIISIIRQSV